jgi:hypothetical protein
VVQGGTAVEETRKWPLYAGIGVAVVGVIAIIALGSGSKSKPKAAPTTNTAQPTAQEPTTQQTVDTSAPPFQDDPQQRAQPTNRPDPATVAAGLEHDLKKQRLWANVTISGNAVEVRSGSCGDAGMAPMLDGAAPAFKAAGLTKLRCVEQSGRVVSDRDL